VFLHDRFTMSTKQQLSPVATPPCGSQPSAINAASWSFREGIDGGIARSGLPKINFAAVIRLVDFASISDCKVLGVVRFL
jgi:hypothetical protein